MFAEFQPAKARAEHDHVKCLVLRHGLISMKQQKIQRMNMRRIAGRRESLKRIIMAYQESPRIRWDKWHFQICVYLRSSSLVN
jgi:hypothetical protein